MARGDVRIAATLACEDCKRRNYQTNKSKRNNPERLQLRKYCRWCRCHTRASRDALVRRPRAARGPQPQTSKRQASARCGGRPPRRACGSRRRRRRPDGANGDPGNMSGAADALRPRRRAGRRAACARPSRARRGPGRERAGGVRGGRGCGRRSSASGPAVSRPSDLPRPGAPRQPPRAVHRLPSGKLARAAASTVA